ncbi:LRR receptor-like serine threonine-protein kinase [Seminavis robusta]|uniref:LRR receptor-like serine threonine-protein kinase n=1 Tax=Seminavis robusta TaxID=568900 RepID=A0A9N8EJZ2_9STRA|nr:LRR receptor-like serine threonine-protein kinase [Seminavis robusta]|eukprot:Sro1107_g242130.1 LRR receptor-like serine threonine-protein kinase (991) ;mRNA; r:31895-35013
MSSQRKSRSDTKRELDALRGQNSTKSFRSLPYNIKPYPTPNVAGIPLASDHNDNDKGANPEKAKSIPVVSPALPQGTSQLSPDLSSHPTEQIMKESNKHTASNSSKPLLAAPAANCASTYKSPTSMPSAVKPRAIPFGDESTPVVCNSNKKESDSYDVESVNMFIQEFLSGDSSASDNDNNNISSNSNENSPTNSGGEREPIAKKDPPSRSTGTPEPKPVTHKKETPQTSPRGGRVTEKIPSIIEDTGDDNPLNLSGISWTEEGVKVGSNAFLARHPDPDHAILYRIVSKEEAADLMARQDTEDTECSLLPKAEEGNIDTSPGNTSTASAQDPKLAWKIRAILCFIGAMFLVVGLFVGIAVALMNVNKLNPQQSELASITNSPTPISVMNESTAPIPQPTSPPSRKPSVMTARPVATKIPTAVVEDANDNLSTHAPTFQPSVLPPVSLYDVLDLSQDTWGAMADSNSPHSKAFTWLQEDKTLPYYSPRRRHQRFALGVFFFATTGARWTRSDSWLGNGVNECEWWDNPNGTGAPHIPSSLDLSFNRMRSNIPFLGPLTNLQTLRLDHNMLSGSFPDMRNLKSLSNLNVTSNILSGTLPAGLGALTKLECVGIAENRLTGALSNDIGRWTDLKELCLHKNQFTGPIPTIVGTLTNLESLLLHTNDFVGAIPSEIGQMRGLRRLLLDSNKLSFRIPTELGVLTQLEFLWLSTNSLSGPIPSHLGLLTSLQGLYLHVNEITGVCPSELGNLRQLKELRLFENKLRSAIPSELGNLASLEQLSIGWNTFSGFIFPEVGQLTNLVELDLASNNLDGKIPSTLANLTNLKHLWLFSNNLEGQIPVGIGQLSHLEQILLFWNMLSGSIPSEVGLCTHLKIVSLESNELTKRIPSELGTLRQLEWLILYDNNLENALPSELGLIDSASWMRFEKNNRLRGSIPNDYEMLTNLEHFSVHGTSVTGSVPEGFCELIFNQQLMVGVECEEVSCDCGCVCYD